MSSPSLAPSASTLSMSSDRAILGKINGHLYIAVKTLIEGHSSSMDEVRHEIRAILSGNADTPSQAADDAGQGEGTSALTLEKMVIRLIRSTRRLPNGEISDDLKRELARLIKKARALCSGNGTSSSEAKAQLAKAQQLYKKLSGICYL
ncbi:MAG TPA: hypothetical protein VL967_12720 [Terracidiphilus sp.]|nr:hypothetical protein [Terracidiphilus sp.]